MQHDIKGVINLVRRGFVNKHLKEEFNLKEIQLQWLHLSANIS